MSTQPAHPVPHDSQCYPGITIRDYFAAAALVALAQSEIYNLSDQQLAKQSFDLADEMCRVRDLAPTDK